MMSAPSFIPPGAPRASGVIRAAPGLTDRARSCAARIHLSVRSRALRGGLRGRARVPYGYGQAGLPAGRPAFACTSAGHGQCRQPWPQQRPWRRR